ncbi:MAG: hypothetical protein HDR19_00990 [Lachnospiraceae bacterium]|nr:hypothetical protein [Lachnospiraceae bacterium]
MNIEQLINNVKKRPGMYVGCLELQSIVHFINGFMFNNVISNKLDIVDKEFKDKFHDWAREQLEKKYNIEFKENRGYFYYITQVNQNPEEGLKIFFDLCDEFFEEFHKKAASESNIGNGV